MKEETKNFEDLGVSQEMYDYVNNLLEKSKTIEVKTSEKCNTILTCDDDYQCHIIVDDHKLLYIGAALLPNITNYLVNILPQFLYPYIVAYLQDLTKMRDDDFTINELYDLINHIINN